MDRAYFTGEHQLMDRRTFVSSLALGTAISLLPRLSLAQDTSPAPQAIRVQNVVLVHGLFADGSCWSEVITDRKSTRLNSSHLKLSRMPSSA